MLHVFSTNRIKFVARTPTTTDIVVRREYTNRDDRDRVLTTTSINHIIVLTIICLLPS
jgi:hypothetical protein